MDVNTVNRQTTQKQRQEERNRDGAENQETESKQSSKSPEAYMEVYTLALAWILFETLVQKNLVRKKNRYAYLSTCILISFKQVQAFGDTDEPFNKILFEQLHSDFKRLENEHSREKTLSHYEIVTLQTLNFNIKPKFTLINVHIQSILTMIDKSLDEILDPESNQNYQKYQTEFREEKRARDQQKKLRKQSM